MGREEDTREFFERERTYSDSTQNSSASHVKRFGPGEYTACTNIVQKGGGQRGDVVAKKLQRGLSVLKICTNFKKKPRMLYLSENMDRVFWNSKKRMQKNEDSEIMMRNIRSIVKGLDSEALLDIANRSKNVSFNHHHIITIHGTHRSLEIELDSHIIRDIVFRGLMYAWKLCQQQEQQQEEEA